MPFTEPGTAQRSVLGFDYFPQPDVVSCLARLYVSCVAKDRQAGFPQPSFDTLNAKGETMRAVQETLTMCGNDVPETVLFAIGILAYGCVSLLPVAPVSSSLLAGCKS